LCSLWCSQAAILKTAYDAPRGGDFRESAAALTSIFLAWIVLSFFCYRQKFYGILSYHLLGPIVGTSFLLLRDDGMQTAWQGFVALVIVMNLVCFPGAVLAMVSRWLHRPSAAAKPPNDRAD